MLFIISFIVSILVLLISIYFIYGRIMSKKETISDTKVPTKSIPEVSNVSSQKKGKKPRKSQKTVFQESGVMKTPEEIVNVANKSTFENFENQESIIEPTRNFYQETANTDVENLFSNNESDINALKIQIDNYATEIKTLNLKLEEANEKIASYENEAESLSEEIKIIKAKLVNAELSKSKIEEQLKQTENSISNSSTKTVELERKLAQNNAENNDLKLKVDFLNSELKSEQEKLKIEQEKLKSTQETLKSEEGKLKSAQEKLKSTQEKLNSAQEKLKSEQEKWKSEQEKWKSEQEKLKSEQEKLKSEQEKVKSLEKEKAEINEKIETDNVNHIKMYQQYEMKIEKLTGDHKLVKNETVKLNSLLQEKEQKTVELNEQIEQLNIKLGDSKKENESISIKLEKVTRELSERAVEATESNKDYRRLSENLESLKLEIGNKENNYESQIQKLSEEIKENLLHFEEEKLVLQQEIMKLSSELNRNYQEIEKTESLSNTLKSYVDEIDQLKKSNSDILLEMESVKIEFSQKTEELKIKAQECLEKDARLKKIDCQNSELKSEIERLHSEISANFEITTKNSSLIEEISLLKSASCNKDEELNMRLNNTLKELKQRSYDLTVLQDQKVDQLKTIEQLKKDLSSRIEKIAELTNDASTKEIVIKELINEKKILESKLENARKTVDEKESQLQNSKVAAKHEEDEEILKQLEMKNNEIMKLEMEKVQFLQDIERMKQELKRNEEYTKLQIFNLQGHLDEKIHALNAQNDAYLSIKDKFDALEQKLSDSVVTKSLEAQFSEEKIEETRLQPDFQICEKSMIITSESRTIEEMQSHIDKLQSELLDLQRKYYELKDASVSHESNQKTQQTINIYPTDIVSIPPTTPEITTSDIHTDKSQSHSHLLESIEKLNNEISEQRLKNQDLQKSFSDSYSEKNRLKSDYNRLSNDYETVKVKYDNLVKEFEVLKSSSQTHDASETITLLEDQLKKCQDDNCQLKIQLESYRETLEKTENCLQNIQASVDQEESNWKICLKSSEQEQERLEEKIKELLNQIEDLRNQKHSDSSVMIKHLQTRIKDINELKQGLIGIIAKMRNTSKNNYDENKTDTEHEKQENEKRKMEYIEIKSTNEKLKEKIEKLKKDKEKLNKIIEQLNEEKFTNIEYENEKTGIQIKLKKLEEKKEKYKNQYEKVNNELKTKNDQIKEIKQEYEKKIKDLNEENIKQEKKIKKIEKEQIIKLRKMDKISKQMEEQKQNYEDEIINKNKMINELNVMKIKLETNIEQLTKRTKEIETHSTEGNEIENKFTYLYKVIDENNLSIMALRNERLTLLNEIEKLRNELSEIRLQSIDRFEEITTTFVTHQQHTTEDTIEDLIQPTEVQQSFTINLSEEEDSIKKVEMQKRIDELEKDIERLKFENSSLQSQITIDKSPIVERTETRIIDKSTDETDFKLTEIYQEMEINKREIEMLENHKLQLTNEIDKLKKEIINKDEEIEWKLKDKNKVIDDLEKQKLSLIQNIDDLHNEIEELHFEISCLQSQLSTHKLIISQETDIIFQDKSHFETDPKLTDSYPEMEINRRNIKFLEDSNLLITTSCVSPQPIIDFGSGDIIQPTNLILSVDYSSSGEVDSLLKDLNEKNIVELEIEIERLKLENSSCQSLISNLNFQLNEKDSIINELHILKLSLETNLDQLSKRPNNVEFYSPENMSEFSEVSSILQSKNVEIDILQTDFYKLTEECSEYKRLAQSNFEEFFNVLIEQQFSSQFLIDEILAAKETLTSSESKSLQFDNSLSDEYRNCIGFLQKEFENNKNIKKRFHSIVLSYDYNDSILPEMLFNFDEIPYDINTLRDLIFHLNNIIENLKSDINTKNNEWEFILKMKDDYIIELERHKMTLEEKIELLLKQLNESLISRIVDDNQVAKVLQLSQELEIQNNDLLTLNKENLTVLENIHLSKIEKSSTNIFVDDCRYDDIHQLKFHIEQLESELRSMQKKYYDLRYSSCDNFNESFEIMENQLSENYETISDNSLLKQVNNYENSINVEDHGKFTLDSIGEFILEISAQHNANEKLQESLTKSSCLKSQLRFSVLQLLENQDIINSKCITILQKLSTDYSSLINDQSENELKRCQQNNENLTTQLQIFREVLVDMDNRFSYIKELHEKEECDRSFIITTLEEQKIQNEERINELLNQVEIINSDRNQFMENIKANTHSFESVLSDFKKKRKRKHRKSVDK